jgi:hypothetical protein
MFSIKYLKLVFLSFIILFLTQNSYSQNDDKSACKVLLPTISEEYNGACKDGLAHGVGTAKGIDLYTGKFKKGFPNGKGKYTWADGSYYEGMWRAGKKSGKGFLYTATTGKELKGIWKDDDFYKEIVDPPYQVIIKNGITGISFYEKNDSEPYRIEVVFQRDGGRTGIVDNLDLMSSTGMGTMSNGFTGYENMKFPFEGNIEFTGLSKMGTTIINYKVRFIITKPTNWKILIRY